jgi:hypothetical protein
MHCTVSCVLSAVRVLVDPETEHAYPVQDRV